MKFKGGKKFRLQHNKKAFVAIIVLLIALVILLIVKKRCVDESKPVSKLPNPASVHCLEQGGELEMRDSEAGQYGVCMFPDNSECEEWAYYRGECAKGENFP